MLKRESQPYIFHQINHPAEVLTADSSRDINISGDATRAHLHELSEAGKRIIVHAGAQSTSFQIGSLPNQEKFIVRKKELLPRKQLLSLKIVLRITIATKCLAKDQWQRASATSL